MSDLSVTINADTTKFISAVKESKRELDLFDRSNKQLRSTMMKVNDVTEEQVNAFKNSVNSLNKVSSGTKNTKQSISILKDEVKKLSIQFNNLSDAAKKSKFGDTISNQVRKARTELERLKNINKELKNSTISRGNNNSGINWGFSNIASEIPVLDNLISKYKGIGIAASAAAGAIKVTSDAIKNNEMIADSCRASISGLENSYKEFTRAIAGGGSFSNIFGAYQSGKNMYNAQDSMGSFQILNKELYEDIVREYTEVKRLALNKDYLNPEQIKSLTKRIETVDERIKNYYSSAVKLQENIQFTIASDLIPDSSNDDGYYKGIIGAFKKAYDKYTFVENRRKSFNELGEILTAYAVDERIKLVKNNFSGGPIPSIDDFKKLHSRYKEYKALEYFLNREEDLGKYSQASAMVKQIQAEETRMLKELDEARRALIKPNNKKKEDIKLDTVDTIWKAHLDNQAFKSELDTLSKLFMASRNKYLVKSELSKFPYNYGNLAEPHYREYKNYSYNFPRYSRSDIPEAMYPFPYYNTPKNKFLFRNYNPGMYEFSEYLNRTLTPSRETMDSFSKYFRVDKSELKVIEKDLIDFSNSYYKVYEKFKNNVDKLVDSYAKFDYPSFTNVFWSEHGKLNTNQYNPNYVLSRYSSDARKAFEMDIKRAGKKFADAIIDYNVNTFGTNRLWDKKFVEENDLITFDEAKRLIELNNKYPFKTDKDYFSGLSISSELLEAAKTAYDEKVSKLKKEYDKVNKKSFVFENYEKNSRIKLLELETNAVNTLASAYSSVFDAVSDGDDKVNAWLQAILTGVQQGAKAFVELSKIQLAASEAVALGKANASAAGLPFPYNLAAMATVTAAVLSTFSSFYNVANKYANGGIVGGSSLGGDQMIARVNSGEMILNGSQQKKLFNLLNGNGTNTSTSIPEIKVRIAGSDLVGVLDNYGKKLNRVR